MNVKHIETGSSSRWPGMVILFVVALWTCGVSLFGHVVVWTAEQFVLVSGIAWPSWAWFVVSVLQGITLVISTLLPAIFWPTEPERGIFRGWAVGASYVLLMAPMRLVQPPNVILANGIQILLTIFAIAFLLLLQLAMGRSLRRLLFGRSAWLALLIAALASYPWLMWGALGSPVDTVLNLVASLLLGILAAMIISWFILRPMPANQDQTAALVVAGLSSAVLLLTMASGFGYGGMQLILIVLLPAFGLAAAAVGQYIPKGAGTSSLPSVAILLGLVAAAPAMLIDPDELALVLAVGSRDLLQWAFYATVVASIIGGASGVLLVGLRSHVRATASGRAIKVSSLASVLLAIILYFTVGQPGFHGEELFVILEDQAELAGAQSIEDVEVRRAFVYETLVNHAILTQEGLRTDLQRFGIKYRPYYLVNGLAVNGGPLLERWLSGRPEVDRVVQNPVLRPLRAQALPAEGDEALAPQSPPWNVQLIGADQVWRDFGVTGEGVVIGQSDSGVQGNHPELIESYRGASGNNDRNWFDPWNDSPQPQDIGGHGTHTLGTILGRNVGIAPGAQWIGCVNLARNLANPSLYLDCMQFMLAPFPQGGDPFQDGQPSMAADVLNNSWGCPPIEGCDANTLLAAAHALRQAGIFTVVSAGNEGPFCESVRHPLAIYDEVLSVGAVDQAGTLAFFSSVGPVTVDGSNRLKPEILAPGVGVLSAFGADGYQLLDGTSMAGPHVTGVVALIWSANPALVGDIAQTEQIILETARAYEGTPPACGDPGQKPPNGTGYGIIDAYAAVEAALALSH